MSCSGNLSTNADEIPIKPLLPASVPPSQKQEISLKNIEQCTASFSSPAAVTCTIVTLNIRLHARTESLSSEPFWGKSGSSSPISSPIDNSDPIPQANASISNVETMRVDQGSEVLPNLSRAGGRRKA